jgi:hypothetical protein
VVLAFSLGGGCMFLIDGVYDGDYSGHHAQHGFGIMIDAAKESVHCSEDITPDVVRTIVWAYVMHVALPVLLITSLSSRIRGIPKFLGSHNFHLGLERLHVKRRSKEETIILFSLP